MVMGIEPEAEDQITKISQKITKGRFLKTGDMGVVVAEGGGTAVAGRRAVLCALHQHLAVR